MNRDFEYNGFATDWIGFEFKRDNKLWRVIKETDFREYQVTYPSLDLEHSLIFTASQYDLMHEYIMQLEDRLDDIGQRGIERSEY